MTSIFNRRKSRRTTKAAVAAAAAVAGFSFAAPAQAGTFNVSQCKTVGLTPSAFAGYTSALWDPTPGVVDALVAPCAADGTPMDVHQANRRIYAHEDLIHRFTLPASMSNTTLNALHLAYTPNQQTASTNPAYLSIKSGGTTLAQHDMTGAYSTSARTLLPPSGARAFEFNIWCSPVNGPGYCNWAGDTYRISGLTMTLTESDAPTGDATGGLLGAGEQTGTRALDVSASDVDSGIKQIDVTLDGVNVGSADFAADCKIDRFRPCPINGSKSFDVDTTKVADGSRLLRVILTDLAGNTKSINKGYITVENVPPPTNTSVPTISGEKRVNRTLTSTPGTWTGAASTYSYRWERYAANGWENIPDATGASFTTTKYETGMRLRLKVTATNAEGSTVAYSDITNPIVAPGPTDPDGDYDNDGIPNDVDNDDDGDGTQDPQDIAPYNPAQGAAPAPATAAPKNGTPNGAGASAGATLATKFDGTRSKTITTRYGQARRITGQLLTADGKPLAGASLHVASQALATGAKTETIATVKTDVNGRFSYTIPAGPSRKITVAYKWFNESSSYTHTTTVTINVRPKIALKVNDTSLRNKQAVRFTGKVMGVPRGATRLVELQAQDGRTWRTFATVRLSKSGTFAYSYRFKRTNRPTTYQFRANIKAEKGWPFLTGQSNSRKVSVRP